MFQGRINVSKTFKINLTIPVQFSTFQVTHDVTFFFFKLNCLRLRNLISCNCSLQACRVLQGYTEAARYVTTT